MNASAFAGWAIDALVASTLLMAAVLLIRVPARRAFGPGIAYLLWALPLLRLILPPVPESWRAAAITPISRAGETLTVYVIEPASGAMPIAAGAIPGPTGLSMAVVIGALWALGAAGFLIFHLIRHARFCRRVLGRSRVMSRVGDIEVVTSDAAPGPLAFGIWRRYVAFPRDFADRYDDVEQALALAHELGHHQRGDLAANWLALGVLAVHWFNPLAWHAFRAFRADQELANDARVLAGRGPALRHAYGRAIVKAAHGGAVSAACHLHTISDLKGRLRMLARSPASRRRLVSGATAVSALVVAGLGLTASSTSAAAITNGVKETIGVPQDVPPPPPAPPAPPAYEAPSAPPAPPVPPAPGVKAHKRVVVVKDGNAATYEGPEAEAYLAAHPVPMPPIPPMPPMAAMAPMPPMPPMVIRVNAPDVRRMRCPGADTARPVVEHQTRGDNRRIIICTNRIDAMARHAEELAANSEDTARNARISARASLGTARAAIEHDRNLSDAQRREALDGIAQAEAELASDHD